jgi:hypothetical protein
MGVKLARKFRNSGTLLLYQRENEKKKGKKEGRRKEDGDRKAGP